VHNTKQTKQVKVVLASIGAGALLAMGGLGVALNASPAELGTASEGPEMTLGETTTTTTAPTEPETPIATPSVTATTPEAP
jgi:hypothetical protein